MRGLEEMKKHRAIHLFYQNGFISVNQAGLDRVGSS